MRRRRWQTDALRDVGQRDTGLGLGERLEDVETARKALHLRGDGSGLSGLACGRGVAAW